jgi:hypothetical protein
MRGRIVDKLFGIIVSSGKKIEWQHPLAKSLILLSGPCARSSLSMSQWVAYALDVVVDCNDRPLIKCRSFVIRWFWTANNLKITDSLMNDQKSSAVSLFPLLRSSVKIILSIASSLSPVF